MNWKTTTKALFIPRFDRQCEKGKVRIAESLASLCQKAGFGLRMTHNEACTAIADACDPEQEISEYLKRDIAVLSSATRTIMPGNAITRTADNRIALTPLYDAAPMYLAQREYRTTRWEQDDNEPEWASIITQAAEASGLPASTFTEASRQ